MPSSRELISSSVLTGSAASVTFSSIPGTYKDLCLRVSTRADAGTADDIQITFNSTNSSYSRTNLKKNGSTITSQRGSSQSYFYMDWSGNGDAMTANSFGSAELYIPNYAGSTNKVMSNFGTTENNSTSQYMAIDAGLWSNTAAITSINVLSGLGNFVAGSSFYLYGIKSS
jgi:hypothetical protein